MQYFLATDIISSFNRSRYGSAGDPVTMIADHGGVIIVQGPNNTRFAVMSIELRTNPDSSKTPVILELIPLQLEDKSIAKPKSKTKKDQASLF